MSASPSDMTSQLGPIPSGIWLFRPDDALSSQGRAGAQGRRVGRARRCGRDVFPDHGARGEGAHDAGDAGDGRARAVRSPTRCRRRATPAPRTPACRRQAPTDRTAGTAAPPPSRCDGGTVDAGTRKAAAGRQRRTHRAAGAVRAGNDRVARGGCPETLSSAAQCRRLPATASRRRYRSAPSTVGCVAASRDGRRAGAGRCTRRPSGCQAEEEDRARTAAGARAAFAPPDASPPRLFGLPIFGFGW